MVSRDESAKQYEKSKNKQKKDLKDLNNQNKMLFRIYNNSGLRREIKKINKIRSKYPKKRCNSTRNSSRDKSESNSSLSCDSE